MKPPRRAERSEDTAKQGRRPGRRNEILAVFARHVAERGFERANFGDIAAELGISKGTIVHHFGTKSMLLKELQESYMRRRRSEAEALLKHTTSADEQLAALIFAFVNYQVLDRTATVAFQREVVQLLDDTTLTTVRRQRAEYRRLVRDVILSGRDSGLFRRCDDDIVSLYIFGSVHWMWTWFDPDGRMQIDRIASEYVATTLRGLLIDDSRVEQLSDPSGPIATLVRRTLEAANDVAD